jgi:hypothetical protein
MVVRGKPHGGRTEIKNLIFSSYINLKTLINL